MNRKTRNRAIAATAIAAVLAAGVWLMTPAATAADMTVYKSPWCGCCGQWVARMRQAGFSVAVEEHEDMDPVKIRFGVPGSLESCHTAVIDGYIVEGHVPAADIARLLAERPAARGLSAPGMPAGAPGMEQGGARDPYKVILFGDSGRSVYSSH